MAKFTRSFGSKPKAKAWIEQCKKTIRGCNYGAVAAVSKGGHYHAFISGDFTEEEAMSTVTNGIMHIYEP